ncbi:MAG: DeoR/GlpR transcriptional regulator [Spirochaetaceae bacterium]|nr:DeoR/GlpR transcriptional regulator [Spirochaetaceae bacterium]
MYAIERTRIIKKYLEEHGQVQVHTLSNLLGVSEVTVRRDLERLEKDDWLTRTHGGAVINRNETADPLFEILEEPEDDGSRDEIASVALRMIKDGDVIMLTNGSVNARLALKLEERSNLTILTNDLSIALRISLQDSNKVVLLGGDMDKGEKALFGSMALSNLRQFYVNRLFIEVDGINEKLQLTVSSQEKADLILGAMELSDNTIVVCPSDHFSTSAFYRLGGINIADGIITNTRINDDYKARIFNSDIPLYTSVAAFEGSE